MTDVDQLISALGKLPTPNLSDAMDRLAISGALAGLQPLDRRSPRMVGVARTLLQAPRPADADPSGTLTRHVEWVANSLRRDDVPVIAWRGEVAASSWGYLLSLRCRAKGVAGAVVDGFVRDPEQVIQSGFAVFARSVGCAAGTRLRVQTLSIGEPVQCGGVQISEGDFIVGDDSGVVAIPRGRIHEVIAAATDVYEREERMIAAI